jgi:Domain of unknown function (DUF6542)
VSQAWQEPPGNGGLAGPGWPSPPPGTVHAWAADELGRVRSAPIWGADADPDGSGPAAADWVPAPGDGEPDRPDGDVSRPPRQALQLTARGAILGLLLLFFVLLLLSNWLGWGWLAGAGFAAGSVAAARYTQRRGLLAVMVTPPLLFCCDLVVLKALTASGNALLSTAGGTALALGGLAPWLFAGVVLALIVAWFRGLPQCVAELRQELHPGLRGGGPGSAGGPPPGRRSGSA